MKGNIRTFIIKIPFNIKFVLISLFVQIISTNLLCLYTIFLLILNISKHTYITYLVYLAYLLLCIVSVIIVLLIIVIYFIIKLYIRVVFNLFTMITIDELYRLYITKTFIIIIRYVLHCTLSLFSIILCALPIKRFKRRPFIWNP